MAERLLNPKLFFAVKPEAATVRVGAVSRPKFPRDVSYVNDVGW